MSAGSLLFFNDWIDGLKTIDQSVRFVEKLQTQSVHFTLLEAGDNRWTSFLAGSEHDVYHKPAFVELMGRERKMRPCACYGESDSARFLLPLLLDRIPVELRLPNEMLDAFSPDGYPGPLFAGDDQTLPNVLRNLASFLRSERIVTCFIRSHPLLGIQPGVFKTIGEVVERGHTIPISLNAPYEQIHRQMRRDHRHDIRTALKESFSVVIDEWDLLADFVRMYRDLMDSVDATPAYRFSDTYFDDFRVAAGGSAHLALVMSRDGIPAAGSIFTLNAGIVQYHLAATSPRFRKNAPQKLIIDALIRWGLEQGARVVHLGGGVGAKDDTLLDFKSGFSRSMLTYSTIHLVTDPDRAEQARNAWMDLHDAEEPERGFFPAHRAPVRVVD